MAGTIKVVYVVSTLGQTGPTRQLYNLVKYLDRDIFDPQIVTLSSDPPDNLADEFTGIGVRLIPLGLTRISSIVFGYSKLEKILKDLKPNVLHSQGLRADTLCAMLDTYPVRIATQRNNPREDYPALYGPLVGTLAARFHIRALLKIPTVVACSKSIAVMSNFYDRAPEVIKNGVELSEKLVSEQEKSTKRRTLKLPMNGRLFLYVGPLIRRKNPEFLLHTFLSRSKNRDTLCLLGSGPLLSTCQDLSKNAKNISVPGFVKNVTDYLAAADIFVSSSDSEGMPNAVLEAISMGLPAILSDIPAHREILDMCPKAGQLFAKNNSNQLAQLFDQAMCDSASRYSAHELAVEHFSAQSMSATYQRLYIEAEKNIFVENNG